MGLIQIVRHLESVGHGRKIVVGAFLALISVCLFLVYTFTLRAMEQRDERIYQAAAEERAKKKALRVQQVYDRLTNPQSGTTPEQMASISIGMTAKEVQSTLGLRSRLGFEIFPYSHRTNGHDWVSDDIPIKGIGYVQGVFIDRQLVGLGSLDPNVGRLCAGCLQDMLHGKRPWGDGLPFQVDGECPVCASSELVPFGVTVGNLQEHLYR